MKARVIRTKVGKYQVQFKTGWFWWALKTEEYGYDGSSWNVTRNFNTEKEANMAMIKMVQDYNLTNKKASEAGVVSEFTSDQLEEKFAEYFVVFVLINIVVFSTTGITII